jgi:hypothetical protein
VHGNPSPLDIECGAGVYVAILLRYTAAPAGFRVNGCIVICLGN